MQAPPGTVTDEYAAPGRELAVPRRGLPWKRIIGSFFLILGIYWTYALAVVPFIEPPASPHLEFEDNLPGEGYNVVDLQRQELTPWFKQGDWELTSPKVMQLRRGKLVFRQYETLADGRLKICPCTIIFLSEGEVDSIEERNRRAVILQAPEGVILKFDTPVDPKRMTIGKLVGGNMLGPITIRSDQRLPGPEDDLLISTRDAELIGDRIVTPHQVDFRLGPNQGTGRDLDIHLAPSASPAVNSPAPGFGGINSLTLKRDVRMRLYPGQADMFPSASAPQPAAVANRASVDPADNPPVDITCEAAFHFDVTRYVATFNKHVDVLRINPNGPSDQLNCEVLSIFFEAAGAGATPQPAPAAQSGGMPKLEPARVEAEGTPVVIRSPSRGVQARGTRLEYDVKRNAGDLRGPGWLKATRAEDPRAQSIEATWQKELKFRPADGVQCAQLIGKAHVESVGSGELNAETIQLFFIEDPTPPANPTDRRRLVPDRMQAFQRVRFDSPTLSGNVDLLQVWLKRPATQAAPVANAGPQSAGPNSPANPADPAAQNTAQHVHVTGKLLQVEAIVRDKATDVSRIHMEGNVNLRETKVAEPGARPLVLRGDQVDVDQPLPNHSVVHVFGKPAHVEAREMSIDGKAIHLDRRRNLAWVDGQGLMTLLVPTDSASSLVGPPNAPPAVPPSAPSSSAPPGQARPLEITWKGGMEFDGRDAMFRDGVVAVMQQKKATPEGVPTLEHQRLTCEVLQAVFSPQVIFDQMSAETRPQISQIICREHVFLEQRTTQAGTPTSVERVTAVDLTAHPASGDMLARGPGWVRRVWVDTGSGPRLPGAPAAAPKPPPPPGVERLAYLGIDFQGQFAGNQVRQTTDFNQRVRCVYGPVPDWDSIIKADDPDSLCDGSVLLTSDHLQVVRAPAAPNQAQPFELTADGNAKLDGRAASNSNPEALPTGKPPSKGQMFNASAARITYSAAKDLLVLEGDGRNYAHLARQLRVGSAWDEQTAGKFFFWPSLNKVNVEGGHELHLQNLNSGSPSSQNSNAASRSGATTK